jgi:CHAT domain-containing protein
MKLKANIIFIFSFLIWSHTNIYSQDNSNDVLPNEEAILLYNKGIDFGQTGNLDSALYYTQKAIPLFENSQKTDSIFLANSFQSLGIINKLLGKYSDAINCYSKAEHIYKLKEKQILLAHIYGNKANIFYIQQDYTKAKNYHNRAIEIFIADSVSSKNQLASSYNNLGNIYRQKRDYFNAINYYERSLSIKGENKNSYTTISNLALCNEKINNLTEAIKYQKRAIKSVIKYYGEENIKIAINYLNYAFLLEKNEDLNNAKLYFQEAVSIYKDNFGEKHPDVSTCYNALGEYYLNQNKIDSSLYYFQKSLISISNEFNATDFDKNPKLAAVFSKTHLLNSLKNKANALSQRAFKNSDIESYKLSLLTYEKVVAVFNEIRSGYISEESKLFLAENEFETFSNALKTSYELYNLTGNKKYLEKAFTYSESGKSAILNESMKNTNALNVAGIPDSLLKREKQLEKSIWTYEELIYEEIKLRNPNQKNLSFWNKYLFEEKQKYSTLLDYLENNFRDYHNFKHHNNSITVSDLQEKISKNETVIEFFLSDNNIYTFLINRKEVDLYKTTIDSSFNFHVNKVIQAISNNNFAHHGYKDFAQFQESSYFVYDLLFNRLKGEIQSNDLIIIPDGILAYLPFEVLITDNKEFKQINYKKLPFFIFSNTISYYHSATFIINNKHSKTAPKNIGAFAPSYEQIEDIQTSMFSTRQQYRERLFPLKGITDEVNKVTELINGDKYLNKDASESNFKKVAHNYDILHLAMHTIMDDQNPMYSKMAFTQTNDSTEDGFLNTYELYNMKLNSRMAVLSSCNSGTGKMQRGEGVMSMARGFIYSGCPSIIMTLWSVEDKSGVKLMTNFYENLIKGKSKSEALRLSKIKFIENADQLRAHPYFWSGYVVIGNNSALFKPRAKIMALLSIIGLFLAGIAFYFVLKHKKSMK